MKRSFECALMAFLVLFFMAPKGMTRALTLGKVSMTGEVKVTGPGGMVYTSTDREAPPLPWICYQDGEGPGYSGRYG